MNSPGLTNIGASPRSIDTVGSCVSATDAAVTVRVPRTIALRAFVVAASAVASDTAVCPNTSVQISLYPPRV